MSAPATVESCARGCDAPGEVPWDGKPLCWGCVNAELDTMAALALAGERVTVCRSVGGGRYRPPGRS